MSTSLYVKETFTEEREGENKNCEVFIRHVIFGESNIYESFTDDVGKLFRYCQKEFGRCRGKVYVELDRKNPGSDRPIGWVFESIQKYDDARSLPKGEQTYKRVVWVEVHDAPPTVTTKHHYHFLGEKENTDDHSV